MQMSSKSSPTRQLNPASSLLDRRTFALDRIRFRDKILWWSTRTFIASNTLSIPVPFPNEDE